MFQISYCGAMWIEMTSCKMQKKIWIFAAVIAFTTMCNAKLQFALRTFQLQGNSQFIEQHIEISQCNVFAIFNAMFIPMFHAIFYLIFSAMFTQIFSKIVSAISSVMFIPMFSAIAIFCSFRQRLLSQICHSLRSPCVCPQPSAFFILIFALSNNICKQVFISIKYLLNVSNSMQYDESYLRSDFFVIL